MKNMMKEYLGNDYSNDHLRNFCLYWIKAYGNGRTESTYRICTDAVSECNDTIERVLRDNNIKLPEADSPLLC